MDKFFHKLSQSLVKLSHETANGCREWEGCKDRHGYGTKRVTWPDGSVKLERVHRVAYMVHHRALRHELLQFSSADNLEVSHLCHNKLCIRPDHLILESHEANCERKSCQLLGQCVRHHDPPCIFLDLR